MRQVSGGDLATGSDKSVVGLYQRDHGFSVLIIDDVVKKELTADERKAVLAWYNKTVKGRASGGTAKNRHC